MSKVKVAHLTKIFGKKKQQAFAMIQEQRSKNEILEKLGPLLASMMNFEVNEGEIFVIMGLSGSGSQP